MPRDVAKKKKKKKKCKSLIELVLYLKNCWSFKEYLEVSCLYLELRNLVKKLH